MYGLSFQYTRFKMYEIFVLWKGKGGGLETPYFTFLPWLQDSILSLGVFFTELMRVGSVYYCRQLL